MVYPAIFINKESGILNVLGEEGSACQRIMYCFNPAGISINTRGTTYERIDKYSQRFRMTSANNEALQRKAIRAVQFL